MGNAGIVTGGKHELYFLSRDGYYLRKAFDLMEEKWKTGLKSRYVYSSRRLLNVAAISDLDQPSLKFLTDPAPNMRIEDFFHRLQLDPHDFAKQLKKHGLPELNTVITTPEGIFNNPGHAKAMSQLFLEAQSHVLGIAAKERQVVIEYLSSLPIDAEKGVAIDIGWQASSVRSLNKLLRIMGKRNTPLPGYYFGLLAPAQEALKEGNPLKSFFVHLHTPASRIKLLASSMSLIEFLFSAPYPTIGGLTKTDGKWAPFYHAEVQDPSRYAKQEKVWAGASLFIQDILPYTPEISQDDGLVVIEQVLTRLLQRPTPEEAKNLGDIQHSESFGEVSKRPIVAPPPRGWHRRTPSALAEAYRQSNWKVGFLARLHEDQRRFFLT